MPHKAKKITKSTKKTSKLTKLPWLSSKRLAAAFVVLVVAVTGGVYMLRQGEAALASVCWRDSSGRYASNCSFSMQECASATPTLSRSTTSSGVRNACVAALQGFFQRVYNIDPNWLKADGLYGPRTEAVVRVYQRTQTYHGNPVSNTGVVSKDNGTWHKLVSDCVRGRWIEPCQYHYRYQ